MPDCILDQWLNAKAGYGSIFHLRCDLRLDPQLIPEADLLDRQIVFQKGHLFHQRDFLPPLRFQRQAEKVAQMLDHPSRKFRIPFDATGKKWVRFAAWDSAGNGAFTQPVHLK